MKIYIVMLAHDSNGGKGWPEVAFQDKQEAEDYCRDHADEGLRYWTVECDFMLARPVAIDPNKINWNGGRDAIKLNRAEDFDYDFGVHRCLWDGISPEDRMKPMGLSCSCPKCSPRC